MKVTFTDVDQQSVNGRTARAVNRTTGEVHTVTIAGGEADFGQLTYQQAYEVYGVTASGARVTQVLVKTETNEPEPDLEAPTSAPGGLAATVVSPWRIDLSWNAVSGATSYEYRIGSGSAISVGANTSAQVTGLSADTQYGFQVRARNNAGAGPWSSVVQATTQAAAPLDPVVAAYVSDVNTMRGAESLAPLGSTAEYAWNEFYLRLKNRDGELSGDLSGVLMDAVCLRQDYNVGGGTVAKGLLGSAWTYVGGLNGAWQASGFKFDGLDALSGDIQAAGLPFSPITWMTDPASPGPVICQHLLDDPNRVYFITASTLSQAGRWGNLYYNGGTQYNLEGATMRSASGFDCVMNKYVAGAVRNYGNGGSTMIAEASAPSTWTPANVSLALGGNHDASAGEYDGVIAVALMFSADISGADYAALYTIVNETLAAGLTVN